MIHRNDVICFIITNSLYIIIRRRYLFDCNNPRTRSITTWDSNYSRTNRIKINDLEKNRHPFFSTDT